MLLCIYNDVNGQLLWHASKLLSALTCYASAVMEMGEFLFASKTYDSTCYASAMIEMGEYCCVLPTPIGFDVLCIRSHGNGRVFVCFQIL